MELWEYKTNIIAQITSLYNIQLRVTNNIGTQITKTSEM